MATKLAEDLIDLFEYADAIAVARTEARCF